MNHKSKLVQRKARFVVGLVSAWLAMAGLALLPGTSVAAFSDSNITSFTASPSYMNVGRTTAVTLAVASGSGNYVVTVIAPNGAAAGSAWFNFTSTAPITVVLGDAAVGFKTKITDVGAYTLQAGQGGSVGASIPLLATDKLFIRTEFAAASSPWTDLHNCPIAEEFQRGDEVIARGYITYASTGETLNGTTVPTSAAAGMVTGTLFGETKDIKYNKQGFWRAAWFVKWDAALGTYPFTVMANDGLGNTGTGVSPAAGIFGSLKIIPAVLATSVSITDPDGQPVTAFYAGDQVGFAAQALYDLHFAHNYEYTKTNKTLAGTVKAPGPGQSYPLGTDRKGVLTAAIGAGSFNVSAGRFSQDLANVPLAFDASTGTWKGSWVMPEGLDGTGLAVRVSAVDGAPTPNSGAATANFTALARDGITLQGPVFYGLLGGLLVVGVAGGVGLTRLRRSGSGPKDGKKGDDWQ